MDLESDHEFARRDSTRRIGDKARLASQLLRHGAFESSSETPRSHWVKLVDARRKIGPGKRGSPWGSPCARRLPVASCHDHPKGARSPILDPRGNGALLSARERT